MRITHRYVRSDSHSKVIKPTRVILEKYNVSYKYQEDLKSPIPTFKYNIQFYLNEDNPNFASLKSEIDTLGLNSQILTDYEKSDYEIANWFVVSAGHYQYPQPEDGYLEKTFDLESYCGVCGIGRIQNAPFRLQSIPKQLNSQFWGLHWEYFALFVRQKTKVILERENIKGINFTKPVLNKKNIELNNFYQLHIETILSQGFDNYNTKKITCKINNEEDSNHDVNLKCCGRVKFHHPMVGGYLFDQHIFITEFDIVQSQEYFGSGASANRIKIVSKRFKNIVEKNKLKGLVFVPLVNERLTR